MLTKRATCPRDDAVAAQGSLPFPSDVATLAAPPYNVGAVVNMCQEWPGPAEAYARHGIAQLRLPCVDTCAPPVDKLRAGAAFIAAQRAAHPGKRVYVHCKGGIARASTMSLAHCVVNRGEDPHAAVERLKARRPIVLRAVAEYPAIVELAAEQREKTKQ